MSLLPTSLYNLAYNNVQYFLITRYTCKLRRFYFCFVANCIPELWPTSSQWLHFLFKFKNISVTRIFFPLYFRQPSRVLWSIEEWRTMRLRSGHIPLAFEYLIKFLDTLNCLICNTREDTYHNLMGCARIDRSSIENIHNYVNDICTIFLLSSHILIYADDTVIWSHENY